MKRIICLLVLALSNIHISRAQNNIQSANIEDTYLKITASASTINNVTFTISLNSDLIELDKEVLKDNFPQEFTVKPFTLEIFKDNIYLVLQKLSTKPEIKDKVFKTGGFEYLSFLTQSGKTEEALKKERSTDTVIKYYKQQQIFDERVRFLYSFFSTQLDLIFAYETEPDAGYLKYSTKIVINHNSKDKSDKYYTNNAKMIYKVIEEYIKSSGMQIEPIITRGLNCGINNDIIYCKNPNYFLEDYNNIIEVFSNVNHAQKLEMIKEKLKERENIEYYKKINSELDDIIKINGRILLLETIKKMIQGYESFNITNTNYTNLNNTLSAEERQFEVDKKKYEANQKKIEEKNELKNEIITLYKNELELITIGLSLSIEDDNISEINRAINNSITPSNIRNGLENLVLKLKNIQEIHEPVKKEEVKALSDVKSKLDGITKVYEEYFKVYDSLYQENKSYLSPFMTYINPAPLSSRINALSPYNNLTNIEYINRSINDIKTTKSGKEENIHTFLKKIPLWQFCVDELQISFNDGFIEDIVVTGNITDLHSSEESSSSLKNKILTALNIKSLDEIEGLEILGQPIKLSSKFPIGFSSNSDFDVYKTYYIFDLRGTYKIWELKLENLLPNYKQEIFPDRTDYSPKDQRITLPRDNANHDNTKKVNSYLLKKEKSSKLFNIKVYSDFIGLNSDNPNGILQFEFNKEIPLYTKRKLLLWFNDRFQFFQNSSFGVLNFITPTVTWSRLSTEDNTKNLPLTYITLYNGTEISTYRYITKLDLLRYENLGVGTNLNLFSYDFPSGKFRFDINAGGRFGRTKVLDTRGEKDNITETTIFDKYIVNSYRIYPEFKLRLRPEERYGADFSWRPIYMRTKTVQDFNFHTITSEKNFRNNLTDNNRYLQQFEINAHFNPTSTGDSSFFFRYKYTNTLNQEYNGFSEIQVGYSMALKF